MKKTANGGTPAIIPTVTPTVTNTITPREQQAIMKSLAAGLVPQIGLHHLVVGRQREIKALISDLDIIKQGGASFRVLVGANGNDKTFLEHLTRDDAIQCGLVVLAADLTVNHRLHATDGRGRALYSLWAQKSVGFCQTGLRGTER